MDPTLLTGATGGLAATAEALAARGAAPALSSRNGPELEQLAASLSNGYGTVVSDPRHEGGRSRGVSDVPALLECLPRQPVG